MTPNSELQNPEMARLSRQVSRERTARLEAERIAEKVTRELYDEREKLLLVQLVTEAANNSASIATAMEVTLEKICRHIRWPAAHLYLCADGRELELRPTPFWYCSNPAESINFRFISESIPFSAGQGLPGTVLKERKPVWIEDLLSSDVFVRASLVSPLPYASGFAVPLLVGKKIVGVLELFSVEKRGVDSRILELLSHLGTQLGRLVEREQAQLALKKSEEQFRKITEHSLDLITLLSAEGVILYETPSIQQVLGYPPAEYLGRNAFEFVHPDDLGFIQAAFVAAIQASTSTEILQFRFRHKEGTYRLLEGKGSNLLHDPGIRAIVFNSRDITDKKKLEEQFLQSQKVQAIGQLAGGVAHDFNNILTAIIGYCDLMFREGVPGSRVLEHTSEIKRAADRAAGLTRQLLAFSRKQILQPKMLDLNLVVAEMHKMLERVLGENIHLITLAQPGLNLVKADQGQLEQVILNLAVNARDAMPTGGNLTIETQNTFLGELYVRGRTDVEPGEYVMLAVSDNGTGITPEVRSRLFEPFFTTKEQGKGTGLGLATCYGIVKQSGGHITIYSEPGAGSTFRIYLPRATEEFTRENPETKPSYVDEMPMGTEQILVVEDEPVLRELAMEMLSSLGYQIETAANGLLAKHYFEKNMHRLPQLLITDVIMPEMGGRALVNEISGIAPSTRVLFTSGYTQDAIIHGGVLEAGIHFLAKPYTLSQLAQKVREVLDAPAMPMKNLP